MTNPLWLIKTRLMVCWDIADGRIKYAKIPVFRLKMKGQRIVTRAHWMHLSALGVGKAFVVTTKD